MPQLNCSMSLKLLLASSVILLQGCSFLGFFKKPVTIPEPVVIIQKEFIERTIPIQSRPKPLSLIDLKFYAVNKENLADFEARFEKDNVDLVFFAISIPDYENLAINMGELRRYIEQQGSIILYYEETVNRPVEEPAIGEEK